MVWEPLATAPAYRDGYGAASGPEPISRLVMRRSPWCFVFDRTPPRQRWARGALAPVAGAAAVAYLVLDRLLTPLLGGVWGVFFSLWLVGVPLGATWWAAETGASWGRAARAGGALGLAAVGVYAWAFLWSWR